MWAFMTTGTTRFLENIIDSHPKINFHLMKRAGSTLVYYEDKKKKGIFVSGRTFEVLQSTGDIEKTGFVVMENIPVNEDGVAVFEDQAKKRFHIMENIEGLIAARLLKQIKSNHFIIFTQWKKEQHFITWQKSDVFKQMDFTNMARLPAYFLERPYTNSYFMVKEEE